MLCTSCRTPKTTSQCESCEGAVCKSCLHILSEDAFSFLPKIPEALSKSRYCRLCYDQLVAPELEKYEATMELAKNMVFLTTSYKGSIPILKKAKVSIKVESCADRDETILRMAFLAALDGYNALVEGEITRKKIRNEAYQKSDWSGRSVGAVIDRDKLELQEQREEQWRRGQ